MSLHEDFDGNEDQFPPSSPSVVMSPATSLEPSPSTSPLIISPPTSPMLVISPPTSPLQSSSSSSSSSETPQKRRKNVCRTTVQRRKRQARDGTSFDINLTGNESLLVTTEKVSVAGCSFGRGNPYRDDHRGVIVLPEPDEENSPLSCSSGEDISSEDSISSSSDSGEEMGQQPPFSPSSQSSNSSSHDDGNLSDDSVSDCEPSVHYLYEGSDITTEQTLLEILKLYVSEKWTKTSLHKSIKLTKRLLPQPNDLPSSGRSALTQLENLTASYTETEHEFCNVCLQLLQTENLSCNHSGGSTKFYSFSVKDQIQHMFEKRGLASVLDSYREKRKDKNGYISDIVDGTEYKKIKAQLPNPYDLVLLWSTDGASLSSSSKQDLWPILATVCEVPPYLRSSFLCVFGIVVTAKKPDMNVFLKPFVDSLKEIWESGVSWTHPTSKQGFTSKVVAPLFSGDAPARAMVLKCKNYNSKYGCNSCEQKTKKIDAEAPGKKRKRRFLFQEDTGSAPLRTGARMDQQGNLAEATEKSCKGVTGSAIISEIPLLDRASCICLEYMHLILLGVVKYLLNMIFFNNNGPWYVGNKLGAINDFFSQIKVPDFVKRLPRGTEHFKYWKASEFRAFLLFYSLPIFKEHLPDEYFQHWILLVGAMHLLLQEAISEKDLKAAQILIRSFVRDIGVLYGEKCYTYNMHTLLHAHLLIERWGNPWATSAFLFESFLGFLTANVHGNTNLGKELVNNVKISHRVAILENNVNKSQHNSNMSILEGMPEFLGKPLSYESLNETEMSTLSNRFEEGFLLYNRARIMSQIFTSMSYDSDMKRANSFVKFKSDDNVHVVGYGQLIVFVKVGVSFYCLIKSFKTVHVNLIFHTKSRFVVENLVPVEDSGILHVLPVDHLMTKVLKIGNYLGIRPNSIEVNL